MSHPSTTHTSPLRRSSPSHQSFVVAQHDSAHGVTAGSPLAGTTSSSPRRSIVHHHNGSHHSPHSNAQSQVSFAAPLLPRMVQESGEVEWGAVNKALWRMEEDVKRDQHLFQHGLIHKVALVDSRGNNAMSGIGFSATSSAGGTGLLGATSASDITRKQNEEAAARRRQVAIDSLREHLRQRSEVRRKLAHDDVGIEADSDDDSDDGVFPTFLAGCHERKGAQAVILPHDQHELEALLKLYAESETQGKALNASTASTSTSFVGGGGSPSRTHGAVVISEAAIAKQAAKAFEDMMIANIGSSSTSGSGVPSSPDAVRASVTSSAINLKHPNLVPLSHYVRAQLDALRYSVYSCQSLSGPRVPQTSLPGTEA